MVYFEPLYVSAAERNALCGAPGDREPAATVSFKAKKNTHNRLIQQGSELVSWRWLQPDI